MAALLWHSSSYDGHVENSCHLCAGVANTTVVGNLERKKNYNTCILVAD